ncbi:MAG: hypothetical protein WCT08_06400 [Patescibacteria group bacterium]
MKTIPDNCGSRFQNRLPTHPLNCPKIVKQLRVTTNEFNKQMSA